MSGTLFVVSGPSGAGKTSLVKALVEGVDTVHVSTSHTTRQPRKGEVDGRHYYFTDQAQFEGMVKQEDFIEYAQVFGAYYGTSRSQIFSQLATGDDLVLEIDWQGARQVRASNLSCVTLFILPPSREALESRLNERGKDDAETIARRMSEAKSELSHSKEFDYLIVNDVFDDALEDIKAIIRSTGLERLSRKAETDRLLAELLA